MGQSWATHGGCSFHTCKANTENLDEPQMANKVLWTNYEVRLDLFCPIRQLYVVIKNKGNDCGPKISNTGKPLPYFKVCECFS